MVDVSVIIACHNGAATLDAMLESLAAQDWGGRWEIVFADNGSTDGSAVAFAAYAGRNPAVPMRRVDASAERGKSFALNIGIAASRGGSLLICDADDTVAAGWLAAMAGALERHDFVAARLDLARLNLGWVHAYRARDDSMMLRRLTHPPYCDIAGGCQLGFRRRLFDTLGGFDPAFAVQEDHDFCIRAHLNGYALHPVPEAVCHYRFRDDFAAIFRQSYSYARYRALLRKRHAPEPFLSRAPWLRLAQRLTRLTGGRLAKTVLARPYPPLDRARFNYKLGQTMGEAAGAIEFGVPPPRHIPAAQRVMQQPSGASG